jgi:hypothetical protein
MEDDERAAAKPIAIARLVNDIIGSPSPRPRYTVGPTVQKFAVQLKKVIPSRWFERIIISAYKI